MCRRRLVAQETRAVADRRIETLTPEPRQAFLLASVEEFPTEEIALILGKSEDEVRALVDVASREISQQIAARVMVIEDEPLIAMDIESLVPEVGHGDHNPHGLAIHQEVWATLMALHLRHELVQRYVALTRNSVFYLDPHVCMRCHYRSTELLWLCPHCHEWNTFVEERIAPLVGSA